MPTPTENFRRQHEDLHRTADSIEQRLPALRSGTGASEVRRLLAQYSGKLGIHLRMEDEALYPRLLDGTDAVVRRAATTLKAEMGTLDGEFQAFLRAWPSAASIEANPSEFAVQFSRIIRTLERRMKREEAELYSLVDALE